MRLVRKTILLLLLQACAQRPPAPQVGGNLQDVVFDRYTPLSRTEEIARRTLPPLTFHLGQQMLFINKQAFREQPVDLAKEKFTVYVPRGAPPAKGYGLLVYIAPWDEPTRPQLWQGPLDKRGLIFVSAENSGNQSSVLDRRLPLALLGYENVRARYRIDPDRVYVGGFSGGSRAAEITALAYPDVFRGALLHAGSDPIGGEAGIYLPRADLFHRFQETRLVYVTGDADDVNLHDDEISRASMREFCVFNIEVKYARKLGHEILDRPSLDQALSALEQRPSIDRSALARCNEHLQQELDAKLRDAEAAIARGDRAGARERLKAIDGRYGGLSAPRILELQARLSAPQ